MIELLMNRVLPSNVFAWRAAEECCGDAEEE